MGIGPSAQSPFLVHKEIQMLKENEVIVTAPFPKRLAHKARMFAAKENISRAELLRRAIKFYMHQKEDNGKTTD